MKIARKKSIFSIFIIIFILFISCQKAEQSDVSILLGTVVSIRLIDGGTQKHIQAAFARIKEIEQMMSVSSDDYESTILIDINRKSQEAFLQKYGYKNNTSTKLDENEASTKGQAIVDMQNYAIPNDLAEVLRISLDLAQISGGTFDPTINPLVDLWGFNSGQNRVPSEEAIQAQLKMVGWQTMTLNENELQLGVGQSIDVGAIAKGYAADLIKRYLQEQGVKAAILDFGGNIVVFGEKPNKQKWSIGIQAPYRPGEYLLILETDETSIVTSGVYERYFEIDGREYFHILDPRTGYPAQNTLLSVTIVHSKSIIADALSTAVFVMGLEQGMSFIEAQVDIEAIFVTRNKNIIISSGLKENIELVSEEYIIEK